MSRRERRLRRPPLLLAAAVLRTRSDLVLGWFLLRRKMRGAESLSAVPLILTFSLSRNDAVSVWTNTFCRPVIERRSPSSWPSPSGRRDSFVTSIGHSPFGDSIQRQGVPDLARQNRRSICINAFFN